MQQKPKETMNHVYVVSLLLLSTINYVSSVSVPSTTPPPPSPPASESICYRFMYNPCGAGTCIDVPGDIKCLCPRGWTLTRRPNNTPFCAPTKGSLPTHTVGTGSTCYIIAATYRITITQLIAANPGLNCNSLTMGRVLNVISPLETGRLSCRIRYTVAPGDTCTSITNNFKKSITSQNKKATLLSLNPGLSCSNLGASTFFLSVCVEENADSNRFILCKKYKATSGSSSSDCKLRMSSAGSVQLYNPGLLCKKLNRTPKKYCTSGVALGKRTCKPQVTVGPGDTCDKIYRKYPGSTINRKKLAFAKANSKVLCDDTFLFNGQTFC